MSLKINEEKAKSGIDNYHNVATHFVTRCGELSEHITDRLAFTVSSVATISVAVTSVIPEGMAVAASSGSAWLGVATASASVAGVFVAMKKPVVWWIYAAQLVLSLSLVRAHGGGVLMLYPLVSCFGALIAAFGVDAVEQRVAESKAEERIDADAELDRELKRATKLAQIKRADEKAAAKVELIKSGHDTTNSRPIEAANVVTEAHRQKSAKKRTTKADKRRRAMLEYIQQNHAGEPTEALNAAEIARSMGLGVSSSTARNDLAKLRGEELNGTVEKV